MRQILLVNLSQRVTAAEATAIAAACDLQMVNHFALTWGIVPVRVRAVTRATFTDADLAKSPAGTFPMLILDQPDEPGALGYHTESGDVEFGKVFVGPVMQESGAVLRGATLAVPTVASVVSHEVMELVADPFVNFWVDGPARREGSLYSLEVADPVQGDQYDVTIKGQAIAVSNFVTPEWFNDQTDRPAKYDWMGTAPGPFQLAKGGYMMVKRAGGGGGSAVYGKLYAAWRKKAHKKLNPASRPAKRLKTLSVGGKPRASRR